MTKRISNTQILLIADLKFPQQIHTKTINSMRLLWALNQDSHLLQDRHSTFTSGECSQNFGTMLISEVAGDEAYTQVDESCLTSDIDNYGITQGLVNNMPD